MKILFVSHAPLRKDLGASKVLLELAEEMSRIDWDCKLISLMDLVPGPIRPGSSVYSEALHEHLRKVSADFDVVDYDHAYLPYPRADFSRRTLLVARSVLLAHHVVRGSIPKEATWRGRVRAWLTQDGERRRGEALVARANLTVSQADLINVANDGDQATLRREGISSDKIAVIPYGLSRVRRKLFERVPSEVPQEPCIAFVGTFDSRKGAGDLPEILETILDHVSGCSFRLFGTIKAERDVLARFPVSVRRRVSVVPSYAPDSLPAMLATCSVGIFPSYVEGFGFGVLEMLAASVPVLAYDVPGPPMMLSPAYLVAAGDKREMAMRAVNLLTNPAQLLASRRSAKATSARFNWPDIARQTSSLYVEHLERRL